jgi:hypothetical protein
MDAALGTWTGAWAGSPSTIADGTEPEQHEGAVRGLSFAAPGLSFAVRWPCAGRAHLLLHVRASEI